MRTRAGGWASRGWAVAAISVLVGMYSGVAVGLSPSVAAAQTVAAQTTEAEDPPVVITPGIEPVVVEPVIVEPVVEPPVEPVVDQPDVSAGVSDSVVRLYRAVFAREPEASGSAYWVNRYAFGMRLSSVAGFFIDSEEWRTKYGEVDNRRFVELLYQNVLGRGPDSAGWDYWSGKLDRGGSRTSILLGFSESIEFVAATGTAAPEAPYFPPIPLDSGGGRRIIYASAAQRVWLIDENEMIHDSYLVSGRRNDPGSGTYYVYSKSAKAWAGHDGITMNHMVRFAWGRVLSIGFHSIPTYRNGQPMQTLDQLGTYRSGGCIRQRNDQALALYNWAPIGTKVVVLP